MLKGQDIVVLAAIMGHQADEPYSELAKRAGVSASEAHAAVRRLRESGLVGADRHVQKRNVAEFLVHGLRYAFPARQTGRVSRGLPTSYAAPVADGVFAVSGYVPVWPTSKGEICGVAMEPLYPTVPDSASADRTMYDCLAVFDMLRGGRLRERRFAEKVLMEKLS